VAYGLRICTKLRQYKQPKTMTQRLADWQVQATYVQDTITVNVRLFFRGVQLISIQNPWEEMDQ